MNPRQMVAADSKRQRLRIEPEARAALLSHLLSDPNRETCGLLSGRGETASQFHPVANISPTPALRYAMDPGMQIEAFRRMRQTGQQLLAIAHSHPRGEAWPSATDIAEANYPEAVYVIVSLQRSAPEIRGFLLCPERGPEPVVVELE